MRMNKADLIKMIQELKEDYNGDVTISSQAIRGLHHVMIYNEIYEVIKEKYPTMELNLPDDCNKIAEILDRNPAQVGYYLRELRWEKKIKLHYNEDEYRYIEVCRKIANYLVENDKMGESIYILAKAINEPVNSITACVAKQNALRSHTTFDNCKHVYDERGRRRIEIEFAGKKTFERAKTEEIF